MAYVIGIDIPPARESVRANDRGFCRSSNSIKVVLRFRPQNRTEIELGGQPIVVFESDDTCTLDVCHHIPSHPPGAIDAASRSASANTCA
jgi:hypothetical protein